MVSAAPRTASSIAGKQFVMLASLMHVSSGPQQHCEEEGGRHGMSEICKHHLLDWVEPDNGADAGERDCQNDVLNCYLCVKKSAW